MVSIVSQIVVFLVNRELTGLGSKYPVMLKSTIICHFFWLSLLPEGKVMWSIIVITDVLVVYFVVLSVYPDKAFEFSLHCVT